MIDVGWFSEMKCHSDNGSIKEHIIENVNYDKAKILNYLKSCKRIAVCPRSAIDCLTGEVISQSFSVYDDGEFCWGDFLLYHIEKYCIKLPQAFINKANANCNIEKQKNDI